VTALLAVLAPATTIALAEDGSPAPSLPLSSNELDPDLLAECDLRAQRYGGYDRVVQSAINTLTDLGVFAEEEFAHVRIGFCGLRRAGGPAASASCASDIILLDGKYANENQQLALVSTLAHEMKHVLQHAELKQKFGPEYCFSERYGADSVWMEKEADAFGDAVGALAVVGRPIEIENACPVAVSAYLDGENVFFDNGSAPKLISAASGSTVNVDATSASKIVKLFARSDEYFGRRWVWTDAKQGEERIIDGKRRRLTRYALSNRERASGPFVLKLSCD
jgi:hypothetical protein